LVAAFGVTLLLAGLLTHWLVSALGVTCLVAGLAGWFREVLPVELEEEVAVEAAPAQAAPANAETAAVLRSVDTSLSTVSTKY
jgi:uncharacterized membrane protein YfbV (UPF0208 family)